jgi:cation diffusion facilitator family transporter
LEAEPVNVNTSVTRKKMIAAGISVASNATLVGLKLFIGLFMGSVSVISEAIHSGIDLLASLIALFAVRTSGKPADPDHPFGHGKAEDLSGTIEALLILVAAVWIIWEAFKKIAHPTHMESMGWGVLVMLVSSVANILVSRMLFRVGKETESIALTADGWHLMTDVYTSAGVMVALAIVWAAEIFVPSVNLFWIDPVAALAVAGLIVRAAVHLTLQSGHDLMDGSLPPEEAEWIANYIKGTKGVKGYHHLRTRKAGSARFVEFHMFVNPRVTVEHSHRITKRIEGVVKGRYPDTTVTIHVEPHHVRRLRKR